MADVKVDCETTAIALATLNLAVGMIDKASLDATLKEAEIAIDFGEIKERLIKLKNHVKDHCSVHGVLDNITFDQG
ncbi:MAG TPA: hypothetical protein VH500_08320 [Nitrososphaeraceae archaeon]